MKKALLLSLAISFASFANADFTGPGYYRIKNYKTDRYASVVDNRGSINMHNTTPDLQAVELHKDYNNVCADPASVLYIYAAGDGYQIEAQGTGIYQIIKHYLHIKDAGSAAGQKLYNAYGEMEGVVKYIGDIQVLSFVEQGALTTFAKGDYNKWYLTPVEAETDNYFGINPTIENNGKYYSSLYTAFPYSFHSDGMKAFYVKEAANGMVVLDEVNGVIAPNTPVIIECSSDNSSSNRIDVGTKGSQPVDNNKLNGVFFNCSVDGHINRVAFDKETMRVPGKCQDGSFGFIIPESLDYIPANSCYIKVSPGSPAEFKIVSQSVFNENMAGINDIEVGSSNTKDVYNLQGQLIRRNAQPEEINSLPAGIYIVGGKKIAIK